jgi:hypothetical protein
MPDREPTHGDILEKIGELKGQINALTVLVSQKREDLNTAFSLIRDLEHNAAKESDVRILESRINKAENKIANWVGACLTISFLLSALPTIFRYVQTPHPEQRQPAARLTFLTSLSPWITPTDSAVFTRLTLKPGK